MTNSAGSNTSPSSTASGCQALKLLSYWQASLTRGRFEDLSKILNPVIRGWINYYGAFRQSALYPVLKHINKALQKWVKRKYKAKNELENGLSK
ncbi:group II intron maturase-specific domain-containing protein [Syntrophomonas wolfei]|uniref:group II intron maturase-specific domain-containing protein n=1 Tax=Syntrophomonas wolfei TaxID=863 RepID=UPI001F61D5AD|nr:group II intron maturase-specific domain-containing protein [Syntrophomonas wolfei]